jgi:predicted  nucleic acid-binding Zn-ribbon protein
MPDIAELYHLQEIDIELRQIGARLQQIRAVLADQSELQTARQATAGAEAALADWQLQQRELNQALGDLRRRVAANEQRLYSGNVKNPKELNDLQLSIEALGRQRGSVEDELLEAMVMVDDLSSEAEQARRTLAELEATWEETKAKLETEQAQLEARQAELTAARRSVVTHIPASLLGEYDHLVRRQRNGVAVAALKGGACQACGVSLPSHTARSAEQGELTQCASCGRILFPV